MASALLAANRAPVAGNVRLGGQLVGRPFSTRGAAAGRSVNLPTPGVSQPEFARARPPRRAGACGAGFPKEVGLFARMRWAPAGWAMSSAVDPGQLLLSIRRVTRFDRRALVQLGDPALAAMAKTPARLCPGKQGVCWICAVGGRTSSESPNSKPLSDRASGGTMARSAPQPSICRWPWLLDPGRTNGRCAGARRRLTSASVRG